MPWLGIPAVLAAAYLAVKGEGGSLWTAISVTLWSIIAFIILGLLALLPALLIFGLRGL